MSKARITIEFYVPPGHQLGDYCVLYGDGGSGSINYAAPLSSEKHPLFPDGAGYFGWGRLSWGHFAWSRGKSLGVRGWGVMSWGRFPWGHGAVKIIARHIVTTCGIYKYAFKCFDAAGNPNAGTPEEISVEVHLAPAAPAGLKKVSYDKDTDILTLEAA